MLSVTPYRRTEQKRVEIVLHRKRGFLNIDRELVDIPSEQLIACVAIKRPKEAYADYIRKSSASEDTINGSVQHLVVEGMASERRVVRLEVQLEVLLQAVCL